MPRFDDVTLVSESGSKSQQNPSRPSRTIGVSLAADSNWRSVQGTVPGTFGSVEKVLEEMSSVNAAS